MKLMLSGPLIALVLATLVAVGTAQDPVEAAVRQFKAERAQMRQKVTREASAMAKAKGAKLGFGEVAEPQGLKMLQGMLGGGGGGGSSPVSTSTSAASSSKTTKTVANLQNDLASAIAACTGVKTLAVGAGPSCDMLKVQRLRRQISALKASRSVSKSASAASSKVAAKSGGKAALSAVGKAARGLGAVGLAVQAGFVAHAAVETGKEKRQLQHALEQGDVEKAMELKKKLRYHKADYLLGKGGTEGVLELGKAAAKAMTNHLVKCAGEFSSWKKERNGAHCVARTMAAPGKALVYVGKGAKKLAEKGLKSVKTCAADTTECAKSIRKGYESTVKSIKKWWNESSEVKKAHKAREAARKAKVEKECKDKDLSWWSCRTLKSRRESEYLAKLKKTEKEADARLESERQAVKDAKAAERKAELKKLYKGL